MKSDDNEDSSILNHVDSAAPPTSSSSTVPLADHDMAAATASPMPAQLAATSAPPSQDEGRQELPRPYKCPLCDKAFHRLEHQTRHIRTHTGEKPHACQFPGCSKRFSRSDELTRHSRIHNNPNSRRGNRAQHAAAAAALANGTLPEGQVVTHILHPAGGFQSAPTSTSTSPNISPPHTYAQYPNTTPPSAGAYYGSAPSAGYDGMSHTGQPQLDVLANAASQVERQHELASTMPTAGSASYPPQTPYYHHPPAQQQQPAPPPPPPTAVQHYGMFNPSARKNSLSAYHYSPSSSQPMSRSHSHEGHGHDQHQDRSNKRSGPTSPRSTAPSSPTYSHGSHSPTPGHTPALTPAHSPRIRPHGPYDMHLPGLRHLSLAGMQPPPLEPLEPQADSSGFNTPSHPYSRSRNNSSMRISEILSSSEGSQRKLPVPSPPTAAMQDMVGSDGSVFALPSYANAAHPNMPSGNQGYEPMDRS